MEWPPWLSRGGWMVVRMCSGEKQDCKQGQERKGWWRVQERCDSRPPTLGGTSRKHEAIHTKEFLWRWGMGTQKSVTFTDCSQSNTPGQHQLPKIAIFPEYLLCSGDLEWLFIHICSFEPCNSPRRWKLLFTDKEMKVQRSLVACPRSHS